MKHVKLLLKTLINNNACVEAARTKEVKYNVFAIVFMVLALFFAVLPTAVNGFNQQGSAWLNSNTYSIEIGLQEFGNSAKTNGLTITLNQNSKTVDINNMDIAAYEAQANDLVEQADGTVTISTRAINNVHRFMYSHTLIDGGQLTDILEVYAFNDSGDALKSKVSNILDNLVPDCPNTIDDKNNEANWLKMLTKEDGSKVKVSRSTSAIIFGKDCYYAILAKPNSTSAVASTYGDYHHMSYTEIISAMTADNNDIFKTLSNWKEFSDLGVIDTRFESTWRSIGIMTAVNAGVILFMGFMVWVLTRGKNNPFRIYTIWDTFKIAFYASLAPGILALLGFIMANFAIMMFVLGIGVRVMWLSMRTLRYQPATK